MKRGSIKFCVIVCLFLLSSIPAAAEPWKPLCNGKDLSGWEQKNGNALYSVEDGQIVGATVLNTPNSFLCTKQFYSDFHFFHRTILAESNY